MVFLGTCGGVSFINMDFSRDLHLVNKKPPYQQQEQIDVTKLKYYTLARICLQPMSYIKFPFTNSINNVKNNS